MRIQEQAGQSAESMEYAGFWPRFASLWLDAFIWMPLVLLSLWVAPSRFYMLYYSALTFVLQVFYEVYLVKRWGGTPGKLIMGLRILKTDGQPVSYREAVLRAAPDLLFSVFAAAALVAASLRIPASDYRALAFLDRPQHLAELAPFWYRPIDIAQNVWNWGELLVLLTNRKRRALHDFLAGTVVARVRPSSRKPAQPSTLAPTNV